MIFSASRFWRERQQRWLKWLHLRQSKSALADERASIETSWIYIQRIRTPLQILVLLVAHNSCHWCAITMKGDRNQSCIYRHMYCMKMLFIYSIINLLFHTIETRTPRFQWTARKVTAAATAAATATTVQWIQQAPFDDDDNAPVPAMKFGKRSNAVLSLAW